MQADSLFLIILICPFMLLISWMFVFDDCILMVSSSDSVLSRVYPMVVLLWCILVGLVICTITGGEIVLSLGIGTFPGIGFGMGCRIVVVMVRGGMWDGEKELSLSDPVEDGDGGKGEEGSDFTLPL